ncbi:MAG: response regulator, partial [Bacteroidetes bacterium]|nr:response regulator [Bacteroidota bacterium]
NDEQGLLDRDVTVVTASKKGGVWLGYQDGGISYWDGQRFIHYLHDQNPPVAAASVILEEEDGRLWIAAEAGIFLFNPVTHELKHYYQGQSWRIWKRKNGNVVAVINFDGMWEWTPETDQFHKISLINDFDNIDGDIRIYLEDKNERLWGTYKGILKEDPFEKRFRHIRYLKGNQNGLTGDAILGMTEDSDGKIVIVSRPNGMNLYDPQTETWKNRFNHPPYDNFLTTAILGNYLEVTKDEIWTSGDGLLYCLHKATGEVKIVRTNEGNIEGLAKDKNDHIWLIQNGVWRKNHENWENFTPENENASFFRKAFSSQFGNLFLVSVDNLYKFDFKNNRFDYYALIKDGEGLNASISSLEEDSSGNIWFGKRHGLFKIESQTRKMKVYKEEQGLPNNVISSILIDEDQNVWVGTNHGLSVLNASTEEIRNFGRSDGIQDEIFLPGSATRSQSGHFYFGGVNGINVFLPKQALKVDSVLPEVLITDFEILNNSQPGYESQLLDRHICETEELWLDHTHTTLRFEFTAMGYSQPARSQYAYQIEGVDDQWIYLGEQRQIFLSGLPRGKMLTLKVKAANHDGIWNENPRKLRIFVEPPFWEKDWFRYSMGGMLILSIIGFYYFRLRSIRRQNIKLQKEIDKATAELWERHQELADSNQSLVSANEELARQAEIIQKQMSQLNQMYQAQANFFANLTHEFRAPLTLILGYLEELLQANGHHRVEIFNQIADNLQLNSRQLQQLINQIMDLVKLESGKYRLKLIHGNIQEQIRRIVSAFQVLADRQHIRLSLENSSDLPEKLSYDPDIINKLLFNLLSNAFKYTDENGTVSVIIASVSRESVTSPLLMIRVEDTGKGIPQKHLPYIFDRFYQADSPVSELKHSTGIGLALVKQLVELHKGEIEVESKESKGTAFSIYLPLGEGVYSEEDFTLDHSLVQAPRPMEKEEVLASVNHSSDQNAISQTNLSPDFPHILLVEDNAQIRGFIGRQLSSQYFVSETEDGEAGLQIAFNQQPDLIISDVRMPGMDGFELCKKVKEDSRTSHIPVILLTALVDKDNRIHGLETGADAYLGKPFSRKELLVRVRQLLLSRKKLWQQFLKQHTTKEIPEQFSRSDQ